MSSYDQGLHSLGDGEGEMERIWWDAGGCQLSGDWI